MTIDNIASLIKDITIICGGVGAIVAVVIWIIKINNGMKCLLRSQMLKVYYNNLDCKTIKQYEKENFEHCYEAYKALKGNSFIEDIHESVSHWTVVL